MYPVLFCLTGSQRSFVRSSLEKKGEQWRTYLQGSGCWRWPRGPSSRPPGAVLADWGADVIKVEHPVTGDPQRGLITAG